MSHIPKTITGRPSSSSLYRLGAVCSHSSTFEGSHLHHLHSTSHKACFFAVGSNQSSYLFVLSPYISTVHAAHTGYECSVDAMGAAIPSTIVFSPPTL